ncbi:MAG: enterotoxin, partial [Bryocella sp.]
RQAKPTIFINLTTGTTASPFWVFYADSIWRSGNDHSFVKGPGSWRQRWITYRDAQTFQNIVERGPLFPLNSLMLHGIIYAREAKHLTDDPGNDFADEVHSYFGTGTQLQELYITPSLLTKDNWDTLATAAKWSRAHASTLVDTHWIGGDPAKGEVYGWAATGAHESILTLRNPTDHAQSYTLNPAKTFDLHAATLTLRSVWQDTRHPAIPSQTTASTKPLTVALAPFQVITFEVKQK